MLCCSRDGGLTFSHMDPRISRRGHLQLRVQTNLSIYLSIYSTFSKKDLALKFSGWPGFSIFTNLAHMIRFLQHDNAIFALPKK